MSELAPLNTRYWRSHYLTGRVYCSTPDLHVSKTIFYWKRDLPPTNLRQCDESLQLSVNLAGALMWHKSDAVVHSSLMRREHATTASPLSCDPLLSLTLWATDNLKCERQMPCAVVAAAWCVPPPLYWVDALHLRCFALCDTISNIMLTGNTSDLNTKPNFIIFLTLIQTIASHVRCACTFEPSRFVLNMPGL